jgi:hypothetical protein
MEKIEDNDFVSAEPSAKLKPLPRGERRCHKLCLNCWCYSMNWGEDVEKEMNEMAPGEECSNSEDIMKTVECFCYQPIRGKKK